MSVGDQEVMSEESEDDGAGESPEEMTYRRKYQMLLERCEVLQQDNERLVHRIQQVYKYTRQVRKERKFLMNRLDNYGDNWRQGIAQYFYENNVQSSKAVNKLKSHAQSSEKRTKKHLPSSGKRSIKDKGETESSTKKPAKDNSSKSSLKNLSNYNFV